MRARLRQATGAVRRTLIAGGMGWPEARPCVLPLPAQGKVGSAFTSVGGHGRGYGGHEAILASFHALFLQHGMVRPLWGEGVTLP